MEVKIYISGPVTGTEDYMKRFNKAETELAIMGYSVINPAKINSFLPPDTTYKQCMDMSLTMLGMCNHIYMLKDWEKSPGANREYGYALAKGMTIWYGEV